MFESRAIDAEPTAPRTPDTVYNCPGCGHWLTEGTLACPDCNTLAYGQHLSTLAAEAQALEREGKFAEARGRWADALTWLPENSQQAAAVQGHLAALDKRLQADADREARWRKRLGPFAPIALFLFKAKSFLLLAFKLKFLLSFLAYFGVYWAMFGWKFAIGFTLSILIHEMGHYVAVRRRGLKADLPFFLPGMGAYVRWYHQGISLRDLSAIALAGPLYGLCAALACLALFWGTHLTVFLILANTGAWINLINLVPIFFFDGAQATYSLSTLQRGLIAALCFIFFGLTVSLSGGELFAPQTQWVFGIIGLVMGWRLFTRDQPQEGDTASMIYFSALVLVLGMLLVITAAPLQAITAGR